MDGLTGELDGLFVFAEIEMSCCHNGEILARARRERAQADCGFGLAEAVVLLTRRDQQPAENGTPMGEARVERDRLPYRLDRSLWLAHEGQRPGERQMR